MLHAPLLMLGMAFAALCAPARAADRIWVAQEARTERHQFEVQFLSYDEGAYRASQAIRVLDRKTGAVIQQIDPALSGDEALPAARFLQVADANGDGHPDISLFVDSGGAGPYSTRNFYLFEPASGQYLMHPGLSELTQVAIGKHGWITSAQRGGCCQHGSANYRFIRGELILMSTREEALSADGKGLDVSIGKRRNGKMVTSTRRRPLPAAY